MQRKSTKVNRQIIVDELTIDFYQCKKGYNWSAISWLTKVEFTSKIYLTYSLAEQAALFYAIRHHYNHLETPVGFFDPKTLQAYWNNIAFQERFQIDLMHLGAIDLFVNKQEAIDLYQQVILRGKTEKVIKIQNLRGHRFELLTQNEARLIGDKLLIVSQSIE